MASSVVQLRTHLSGWLAPARPFRSILYPSPLHSMPREAGSHGPRLFALWLPAGLSQWAAAATEGEGMEIRVLPTVAPCRLAAGRLSPSPSFLLCLLYGLRMLMELGYLSTPRSCTALSGLPLPPTLCKFKNIIQHEVLRYI